MTQQPLAPPTTSEPESVNGLSQFALPLATACAMLLLATVLWRLPFVYVVSVTLGMVQGLAEFLPISSSAHLILTPWFFGWPDPGLAFDVALHAGTLVAVVVYFWRDWVLLLRAAPHPRTPDGRLFWLLLLGAIPGSITGILLDSYAESLLRSPLLIATTLALMGVVLFVADRLGSTERAAADIDVADALVIGAAQALAIIPGVSRAGITIAAARLRGIERATAARFSFLLGTPIIVGAAAYKLRYLIDRPSTISGPFLAGTAVAALTGTLTIGLLLRYLERAGLGIFVLYRLALALVVLAAILAGAH